MRPGNLVKIKDPRYYGCKEGYGLVIKVQNCSFNRIGKVPPRNVTYVTVRWNSDTTTIEEDDQLVVVSK